MTLNDFYPYGEENGDTAVTPATDMSVPLEQPIDNFAIFQTNQLNVTNIHVSDTRNTVNIFVFIIRYTLTVLYVLNPGVITFR